MVVALKASTRCDLLPGSLASIGVCGGHECGPQLVVVGVLFLKYVNASFTFDRAFPRGESTFPS